MDLRITIGEAKEFETIARLSETGLHKYMKEYLANTKGFHEVISAPEWIYAQGDIPVMLVAHLDTVHTRLPDLILYDDRKQMMWSPQGIGGDDRCGIWAIKKILKHFSKIREGALPSVLLTTGEEIGGKGASQAVKDFTPVNIKFIVEIDRKGNKESVYYSCGNKEFIEFIDSFGFKKEWGTFSDISFLCPGWDIAGVNLSAGYYGAHTTGEYIQFKHLNYTIARVIEIIKSVDESTPFYDYQREVYSYYGKGGTKYVYDDDDYLYDGKSYYAGGYGSVPSYNYNSHKTGIANKNAGQSSGGGWIFDSVKGCYYKVVYENGVYKKQYDTEDADINYHDVDLDDVDEVTEVEKQMSYFTADEISRLVEEVSVDKLSDNDLDDLCNACEGLHDGLVSKCIGCPVFRETIDRANARKDKV